jgi:dynein heavy chain
MSDVLVTPSLMHDVCMQVGDLAAASPATVSRCGMVYLEPHQLGWRPLLASWANVSRLPGLLVWDSVFV